MTVFDYLYKHNIKAAKIHLFLMFIWAVAENSVYVCIVMHAFILTHTWTHTHKHIAASCLDC